MKLYGFNSSRKRINYKYANHHWLDQWPVYDENGIHIPNSTDFLLIIAVAIFE